MEGATARPLRIVIGLEGLALGGCPINAVDLGRTLRDRGHHVRLFALDEDVKVSLLPYAELAGFQVSVLPGRPDVVALSLAIGRFASADDTDVVHVFAPWLGPAASVAVAPVARRAAVVTNWTMSNVSYVPQSVPMILGTRLLQEAAQSGHRSPVWLIEPPVDLAKDRPDPARGADFRREWGIADDDMAAVLVSRIDSQMKAEGIGYAMRAVAASDATRMRLVLVGDGNAFDSIMQEADRINKELGRPAIILTGALRDPHPAYAAANVTLGMGGSALRSLAHGKPLIVVGENGYARIFSPSSAAYFYEFGFFGDDVEPDPVGHLRELLETASDVGLRRDLGIFGLSEVQARFALDVAATRLEAIYRDAVSRRPSASRRYAGAVYVLARNLAHEAKTAVLERR